MQRMWCIPSMSIRLWERRTCFTDIQSMSCDVNNKHLRIKWTGKWYSGTGKKDHSTAWWSIITFVLDNGCTVHAVTASQVDHIELEHCNIRIQPNIFTVKLKEYRRNVKILLPSEQSSQHERETFQMKFQQFPLTVNNATTGHKLQGSGVDELFIHEWRYNVKNYPYVVLSRVTTLEGLFLRNKLSPDLTKYAMPDNLSSFLQRVRLKHTLSPWATTQYEDVIAYLYRRR